jgi:hypothetical protein
MEPIKRKVRGPGRARFSQADVTRAISGATKAGMQVGRVEIDVTGKIVILSAAVAPPADSNPWDRVFAKKTS